MPSNSINNDHGKSFTRSLATISTVGSPTLSATSINGIYNIVTAMVLSLSNTSLLSSTTMGQPSGIILSGEVFNITQRKKEKFSFEMPMLAVVGSNVLLSSNTPMTSMGLSNGSSGDQIICRFSYTLPGAYTSSVTSVVLNLS
tara:strand:+ start:108 stop:536 length:429 start_codon:yes stop_codon:yes gene_type:complete